MINLNLDSSLHPGEASSVDADPVPSSSGGRRSIFFQPDIAADLATNLATLKHLDLYQLRIRWRKLGRSAAPDHLSRPLLLRLVAYKLQASVHGELEQETARYLTQIAKARVRRLQAGDKRRPKQPPPIPPVPPGTKLKPGTLIGREFNGTMHRVTIADDGFCWNGKGYKSLSEIARLITGTRWNGPRFFGLRRRSSDSSPDASLRSENDVG